MELDPAHLDRLATYKIMTGSVVPRPIAFVSTVAPDGTFNAAPFSWFTTVCPYPPIQCVNISRRQVSEEDPVEAVKDTLANIKATGEFVINVVDWDLGPRMVIASASLPRGRSEFEAAGLTPLPGVKVKAPRIKESPIHMECQLLDVLEYGAGENSLVIGQVILFHVRDDLYQDGKIDLRKLRPLGRLAGVLYCSTDQVFELAPPSWDPVSARYVRGFDAPGPSLPEEPHNPAPP